MADLARVRKQDLQVVRESVDLGREKMAAWIKLIEEIESTSLVERCKGCGKAPCTGEGVCAADLRSALKLRGEVPLEETVKMSTSRWLVALRIKRSGNAAFSIKF